MVVEFLDGQEDAVTAIKTYNELQRHFYWEEKNLGLSIAFGRAGAAVSRWFAAREIMVAMVTLPPGIWPGVAPM